MGPAGAGPLGRMRSRARRPEALHVLSPPVQAVDPLVQPGHQAGCVTADGIPLDVEGVVSVVVPLRVGGVGPEGLHDHGVDDEARE